MQKKTGESLRRLILGLRDALGETITSALDDPTVVEIMLNPDGRLFIERNGQDRMEAAGTMAAHDAETVIGKVAHAIKAEVDQQRPIISGELPLGGHPAAGFCPSGLHHPQARRDADRT